MPRTSKDRFYRAYGNKSVKFRTGGITDNPFQPYDEKDVQWTRYYNNFGYETTTGVRYDVRIYTTDEIAYEKDGEFGDKLPHHTAIEKHFREQIAETVAIFDKIPNDKQNEKGIV